MPTVLITGGTGLIGKALTDHLIQKNYDVIILTRDKAGKKEKPHLSFAEWDISKKSIDEDALKKADAVIHLAGAGVVDKKWSKAYKQEILSSRTETIELITNKLQAMHHQVKVLVSASAIGWYGEDAEPGQAFTEDDPPAGNFLGETCKLWEAAADTAKPLGIRVCKLRTGIVLSSKGGALEQFQLPVRFGIAPILSKGTQMVSWIHIADLCRMYRYALEHTELDGSYNAVAPSPVTNKELGLTLAKEMRGQFFVPMHVPAFVLKLMKGQRSTEILKSTTVSSTKIKNAGFTFLFPTLQPAIHNIIKTDS